MLEQYLQNYAVTTTSASNGKLPSAVPSFSYMSPRIMHSFKALCATIDEEMSEKLRGKEMELVDVQREYHEMKKLLAKSEDDLLKERVGGRLLQDEIVLLRSHVAKFEDRVGIERDDYEATIKKMTEDIKRIRLKRKNLKSGMKSLSSVNESLCSEIKELRTVISNMEMKHKELDMENAKLKEDLAAFSNKVSKAVTKAMQEKRKNNNNNNSNNNNTKKKRKGMDNDDEETEDEGEETEDDANEEEKEDEDDLFVECTAIPKSLEDMDQTCWQEEDDVVVVATYNKTPTKKSPKKESPRKSSTPMKTSTKLELIAQQQQAAAAAKSSPSKKRKTHNDNNKNPKSMANRFSGSKQRRVVGVLPFVGDETVKEKPTHHIPASVSMTTTTAASAEPVKRGYVTSEVVRKKDERSELRGFKCELCKPFYDQLGKNVPGFQDHVCPDTVSRHRSKQTPPNTPPGFWSLEFPDQKH